MECFSEKMIRKIPILRWLYKKTITIEAKYLKLLEWEKELEKKQQEILETCRTLEIRQKALEDESKKLENGQKKLEEEKKRLSLEIGEFGKKASLNYENLKKELRDAKQVMNERNSFVHKKIDGNHSAVVKKQREDMIRNNKRFEELEKDMRYYYFKGLHPDQYEENLKEWYQIKTGEPLNLENPVTYNEKIQWIKLYGATPERTKLADKYQVREYVKEKIGEEYLIPLLGVWENPDDINFERLPDRFVLKTNHGSAWNIIVPDKSQLNMEEAKSKLRKWMGTNFAFVAGLEMHYKNIKPLIIGEEYLENENGEINDYKIFCFNGKPKYVLFVTNRKTHLQKSFFDCDWNKMPFSTTSDGVEEEVKKPQNLEEMLMLAEKLAEGFCLVRVDFYCLNDGSIKFGEMTFTPFSGAYVWNPPEYNRIWGDMVDLSMEKWEK